MIHEAGPYDASTFTQRCVRCGDLVAVPDRYTVEVEVWNQERQTYDVREEERQVRGRQFPTGALVELTKHGACMVLSLDAEATCQQRTERAVA